MSKEHFEQLIATVTAEIAGRAVDPGLADHLNATFPAGGETFHAITTACHEAIAEGWMCRHEGGGIRFGRVVKPSAATAGFSVDVVHMADVEGPHHRHPNGEVDMIMPITAGATFDGKGEGWLVYGPDSAHSPTVAGGEALILYLLPDGAIDFTGSSSA